MTGQTISHYRNGDKLGQGGMGVVHKAEDTKLKRTVALKFLPPEALDEPELRARFLQEAQAAAALNHPNVCTIFEIDEERGFLAMEFLEGETVRARAHRRPLPVPEALDFAMQALQGLQAAHERGVVHRDIKSANLMITPQGTVKIMDFGLARLTDRTRLTKTGTAVGTPAYMSPEQAQGKAVDRRSDLWSLGVVLYEMVAGQLPFRGESEAAVVHSILHDDPEPVTALRAGLPLELDRVIGKALAKEPGERYQHAEDLQADLRALRGRLQLESRAERRAAARKRRRGLLAAALGGFILGVAGAGAWAWSQARTAAPPPVVRFSFDLPPGSRIAPTWDVHLGFSRDSKTLLYPVNWPPPNVIYSRRLDDAEGRPLEGAKGLANPLYSPDNRWLLMTDYAKGSLVKVPVAGGGPVPIAEIEQVFRGDWGRDGYIYWTNQMISGIVRTPENGGPSEPVTELNNEKQERNHRFARLLPGGNAVLFTVAYGGIDSYNDARIDVFDLRTKKRKPVVQGGTCARYSPSGHIVYARGGSLYAIPIDADSINVKGPPLKVVAGVLMSTNIGTAYYDVSPDGDLAYAMGPAENGERLLFWVDRQGKAVELPLPPRSYLNPRISPDGRRLAVEVEGPNHDFYLYDFERGVMSRMTNDGLSHAPIWTPDGKRLAFRTWKYGKMALAWMPADRSTPAEKLMDYTAWQSAVSFSPDGKHLVFDQIEPDTGPDVWIVPMEGDRKPRPFSKTEYAEGAGKFSPDGAWVVYCSMESGRAEIYVQSWPGPGPKIQISSEGGTDPVWRRDGKEIFYRNGTG